MPDQAPEYELPWITALAAPRVRREYAAHFYLWHMHYRARWEISCSPGQPTQ